MNEGHLIHSINGEVIKIPSGDNTRKYYWWRQSIQNGADSRLRVLYFVRNHWHELKRCKPSEAVDLLTELCIKEVEHYLNECVKEHHVW